MVGHYQLRLLCYAIVIALTLWAAHETQHGLEERIEEGKQMHTALSLAAMESMEKVEWWILARETFVAENEHETVELRAQDYQHEMELDQEKARDDQAMMNVRVAAAASERARVQDLRERLAATDQARLDLVHQIEETQQHEDQLELQIHNNQFHQGLCAVQGIRFLCRWMGGLTQLEDQANETAVELHREIQALDQAEQQERLEKVTIQALTNESQQNEQLAAELNASAQAWRAQAHHDAMEYEAWEKKAAEWQDEVDLLKSRRDVYEADLLELSHNMKAVIASAHEHQRASEWAFEQSLLVILIPLGFIFVSVANRAQAAVTAVWLGLQQQSSPLAMWQHKIVRTGLHVLFFMVALIWFSSYVGQLESFGPETRAVVIFYFAAHTALLESLCTQAVPHLISELDRPVLVFPLLCLILRQFSLRALLLLPIFAMEFLLAWWSPLRATLFFPSDAAIRWRVCALVALLTYSVFWARPHSTAETVGSTLSSNSTLASPRKGKTVEDDDFSFSTVETTPLKTEGSLAETDLFPELVMEQRRRAVQAHLDVRTHYSLDASSPYHIDVGKGLSRMAALGECLVLYGILMIVHLDVNAVFAPRTIWAIYFGLALFLALLWLTTIVGKEAYRELRPTSARRHVCIV